MNGESTRSATRIARAVAALCGAACVMLALTACGQSAKGAKSSPGAQASSQQSAQNTQESSIKGTVEYVEGDVTINGLPTQIGAVVNNGDTIKTGNDGVCDITFLKRNIVQIQSGSLAVVNFSEIGRGIQLESGALAAVLKNLTPTKTGRLFQVDTPTTVAGVRGTSFFVKVLNINSTYFCLCNGKITLQDNAGNNQRTLEAAHHAAVEYIRENGEISVVKRPMLYHTDAEMQQLASKIGYTINWSKPDLTN